MNTYELLTKVREQKPLVHHLTNWVTIYDCAQIVKSLGASPVMAHAAEEVADMAGFASSLVLNIGTLTPEFIESMKLAAKAANARKAPVVLDVCGAGATKLRDDKCFELLDETRIDIIKGNASEIARIAGEDVHTKGVDSSDVAKDHAQIAQGLAKERDCTVIMTGEVDIIADKNRVVRVMNGHEMMTTVVGTGCMAASVIGAFAGVADDLVDAGAAALSCYGIAAELSVKKISAHHGMSPAPMAFKLHMMDELFSLDESNINEMTKIQE